MPPALIIAGVGAAASIGGAVLGSSAQKKAANKAADTAAANTATNNALVRETYAQNAARLDPYSANGLRASNVLSESLGLGTAPAAQGTQQYGPAVPAQSALAAPTYYNDYTTNPNEYNTSISTMGHTYRNIGDVATDPSLSYADRSSILSAFGAAGYHIRPATTGTATGAATSSPVPAQPSAQSAFDTFRNSDNYKFRLDQGNKGLNQQYAANGMLESGAALKGFSDYNQNMASSELGNWQNILAGQQNMGLTAASALAGVSTNATGSIVASNTAAANTAANAALVKGQANAGLYNSIGSAIGSVAGSIGRTSYSSPVGASNIISGGAYTPSNALYGGSASYTPINYSSGF